MVCFEVAVGMQYLIVQNSPQVTKRLGWFVEITRETDALGIAPCATASQEGRTFFAASLVVVRRVDFQKGVPQPVIKGASQFSHEELATAHAFGILVTGP